MSTSSVSSISSALSNYLLYLQKAAANDLLTSSSSKKTKKHDFLKELLKTLQNLVGDKVTVKSKNSSGSVTGTVEAVKEVDGKLKVVINGVAYDLSDVTQVYNT